MPIFIKDNKNFLFIHVPKAGGTSMEKIFFSSGWSISYIDFGGQGSLNHLRRCSPQHMHKEMLQSQFELDKFDEIFMVVRNPYERFCSEYCWANQSNLSFAPDIEVWARKAIEAYTVNNYILDNHLRPQNEFQLPNANIYKLEHGFEAIIKDLESRHNLKLTYKDIRELARNSISGLSPSKVVLNQSAKELVYNHYSEDFKCYGYDK